MVTVRKLVTTNGRDPFQDDDGNSIFETYETTKEGWVEIEKQNLKRPNHLKHQLVKVKAKEVEPVSYVALKKEELVAEVEKRGLPADEKATKADLVSLLESDDESKK